MKKLSAIIIGMILALGINVYADSYTPKLIYNSEEKQIENIKNDDGRVILPFRAIFEMMGATVDYDGETSKVTAVRDDKTITFYVNGDRIFVTEDGETSEIPAQIGFDYERNRVMVPVRFISNALGARVGWNGEQKCVYILDIQPLAKSLVLDCPDFFKYLEKTSVLEKNVKSETSFDIGFSNVFDNNKVSVDLKTDLAESSYENKGTGSLKLDFLHKNLDDVLGYNLGEIKGLTFDVIKTEDAIYLNSNLPSKLSSLLPDEENVTALEQMINKNTWIEISSEYIEENFDKMTADIIFKGVDTMALNPADFLVDSLSEIAYSDEDVTEKEMYSVKQFFDTYKKVLQKSSLKETGTNSFEFKFKMDIDDLLKLAYPEDMMADAGYDKDKEIAEFKSIFDFDLDCTVKVRNGVVEKQNCSFDFGIKDAESDLDMKLTLNTVGSSKKLTSAPKVNIPKDTLPIEALIMLFN